MDKKARRRRFKRLRVDDYDEIEDVSNEVARTSECGPPYGNFSDGYGFTVPVIGGRTTVTDDAGRLRAHGTRSRAARIRHSGWRMGRRRSRRRHRYDPLTTPSTKNGSSFVFSFHRGGSGGAFKGKKRASSRGMTAKRATPNDAVHPRRARPDARDDHRARAG